MSTQDFSTRHACPSLEQVLLLYGHMDKFWETSESSQNARPEKLRAHAARREGTRLVVGRRRKRNQP